VSIVTRRVLERLYPTAELEGFEPTHWVELIDTRSGKVIREDAVVLGDPEGPNKIRYACTPRSEDPVYALIPPNRWQCLDQHGLVRGAPVRYLSDYVPPAERDGVVYFVQSTGPARSIKIGWSQDVERRISELQTANAHRLVLLGTVPGKMEREAALHAQFAHLRMEAEWFRDAPEIHAFIEEHATGPIPVQE
jgi:hypothetical protein